MNDRTLEILARPGALRWAMFIIAAAYFGLWLFGFDNVMDRLGYVRPAP